MGRAWELIESSVILRGVLAIMFGLTACALWVQGMDIPESLTNALMLILGSMFQAAVSARKKG